MGKQRNMFVRVNLFFYIISLLLTTFICFNDFKVSADQKHPGFPSIFVRETVEGQKTTMFISDDYIFTPGFSSSWFIENLIARNSYGIPYKEGHFFITDQSGNVVPMTSPIETGMIVTFTVKDENDGIIKLDLIIDVLDNIVEDDVLFNADRTELISYPPHKNDKNYAIPDGVKVINNSAFKAIIADNIKGNPYIESIIIPESVEEIGAQAFYYCENLTNISVGENIESIGESIITGTKLFNENNEDGLVYVGKYLVDDYPKNYKDRILIQVKEGTIGIADNVCFPFTDVVKTIILPDSLEWIGNSVFSGYSPHNNIDIKISKNIKKIGFSSFMPFHLESETSTKGTKIYGYPTTIAQEYAINNDIEFIVINEPNETNPTPEISETNIDSNNETNISSEVSETKANINIPSSPKTGYSVTYLPIISIIIFACSLIFRQYSKKIK